MSVFKGVFVPLSELLPIKTNALKRSNYLLGAFAWYSNEPFYERPALF